MSAMILSILYVLRAGKIDGHDKHTVGNHRVQARLIFVHGSKAVADVLQPQAVTLCRRSVGIEFVLDGYLQPAILTMGFETYGAALHHARDSMLDGVFNQRLQKQRRHDAIAA